MITRTTGALIAATALATSMTAVPAMSQQIEAGEIVALDDWDSDELYTAGISIDRMMEDAEVYGPTGEEIGSVENVLIGPDGRVLSIIAQVGGFWDIGDTHVNVPWDQIEISMAGQRVVIPVTEETAEDYSLYDAGTLSALDATGAVQVVDDDVEAVGRVWRASDLIGDYARLRDGDGYANYGYVRDAIIRDGQIAAVIVDADVGWDGERGPYAYPYYGYGYGWNPGANYYDMPYERGEIEGRNRFDYGNFPTDL